MHKTKMPITASLTKAAVLQPGSIRSVAGCFAECTLELEVLIAFILANWQLAFGDYL